MNQKETYFIRRRGRIDGPWTLEKLVQEVSLRKLGRHHEVSCDRKKWTRASELTSLFPASAAKPPHRDLELDVDDASQPDSGVANQENAWYYHQSGQQLGPVSFQELNRLVDLGQLRRTDLVWRDGMDKWQPLEDASLLTKPRESPSQAATIVTTKKERLATPSVCLAFGLLITCIVPFLGVLGIIPATMGILSLSHINASDGTLTGTSSALAATILGGVTLIVSTAIGIWTWQFGYPFNVPWAN